MALNLSNYLAFRNAEVEGYEIPKHKLPEELPVLSQRLGSKRLTQFWSEPGSGWLGGYGIAVRITGHGPDRFEQIQQKARKKYRDLNPPGSNPGETVPDLPVFFGGGAFKSPNDQNDVWNSFPSAQFFLPSLQLYHSKQHLYLIFVGESELRKRLKNSPELLFRNPETPSDPSTPSIIFDSNPDQFSSIPDHNHWKRSIDRILDRIHGGELHKLVLARKQLFERGVQSADLPGIIPSKLNQWEMFQLFLRPEEQPYPFLMGFPPELLVRIRENRLETESLAGTTGMGRNESDARAEAQKLKKKQKDRAEHSFVVRHLRSTLSPFVDKLNERPITVRSLPEVQHLCTPMDGAMKTNRHVLEVVNQLHPTPAVGGVPVEASLKFISEYEPFSRGWYAGPIGWFNARGEGTFTVGIRTGLFQKNQTHLFAGAGVVEESVAEKEWRETDLKFRSIRRIFNDFFSSM